MTSCGETTVVVAPSRQAGASEGAEQMVARREERVRGEMKNLESCWIFGRSDDVRLRPAWPHRSLRHSPSNDSFRPLRSDCLVPHHFLPRPPAAPLQLRFVHSRNRLYLQAARQHAYPKSSLSCSHRELLNDEPCLRQVTSCRRSIHLLAHGLHQEAALYGTPSDVT